MIKMCFVKAFVALTNKDQISLRNKTEVFLKNIFEREMKKVGGKKPSLGSADFWSWEDRVLLVSNF